MSLLFYIVFGAIVGWVASIVMRRNGEQGALGNIVVGILGAFLGGLIMSAFGQNGVTGFNIYSFLVALAGACILLFIYNAVRSRTAHHSV
jgi:uncharacterized membrane protein YeaQ/YmgE (transglycosylase-associated protein family)